jgi:hypothetical protein
VVVRGLQRVRQGVEVRYQVVDMPVLTDPGQEKSEIRNPKSETNPKSK